MMRELKDYYALLGVSSRASEKEIKQAFRRLAHKFHPDKQGESGYLQEYYLAFSEAYKVLSDPKSRKIYDREFSLNVAARVEVLPEPEALLSELRDMSRRVGGQQLHLIDMEYVRHFIGDFMAGPKAVLLLRSNDKAWVRHCLSELLALLEALPDRFIPGLYTELTLLLQADKDFKLGVDRLFKKAQRNLAIRSLYPYIVLLLTLLLCLGMYFYASV